MQPEAKLSREIQAYAEPRGWLVERTHGNRYQSGFPDLFLAHVDYGQRWVDVKRADHYTFTRAQRIKWPEWERNGVGIWILCYATQDEYNKLFGPPNWRDYWKPEWEAPTRTTVDRLLSECGQAMVP